MIDPDCSRCLELDCPEHTATAPPPPADPWPRCPSATAECQDCHGLGLLLPEGWLTSPWSMTFLVPDESLGALSPEAFLTDILLAPAYPRGEGFCVLPTNHPAFAAVLRTVEEELGIAHDFQRDPGVPGRYLVRRKDAAVSTVPAWRVRHVRTVLFLEPPPRAR